MDSGHLPMPNRPSTSGVFQQHLPLKTYDGYRPLKLLLAGGLAGAVSRTITAPIDRVKMLMQLQTSRITIPQTCAKILAEGSLKAFFRGNGANVLKIAPETAIKLTLNEKLKTVFSQDPKSITPLERLVSGAISGAVGQGLVYPLELVRTRLAVSPAGTYKGIVHAAKSILRQEGVRSFYRGICPSMIGILPYAGVDIMLFELLKERLIEHHHGDVPAPCILGAGMASSLCAQVISYPLTVVRTRLQAQGTADRPERYSGMTNVFVKTIRTEGYRGLYKGIVPNMLKLAPAAAMSWYIFEESKRMMGVDSARGPLDSRP